MELLRSAHDAQTPVPGLDGQSPRWLLTSYRLTSAMCPSYKAGNAFYGSMPEMNARELAALSHLSLDELADHLERGTSSLLSLCASGQAPARFFDLRVGLHVGHRTLRRGVLVDGLDIHERSAGLGRSRIPKR